MAEADYSTLRAGDRIDDYRIEKVLGAGSFGVTYLALDEKLDRRVAIKEYMPAEYARRDQSGSISSRNEETSGNFEWGLERFSEEARTLARFSHPNIVRVLRIVQGLNGSSYMVMELLGGADLEKVVERDGPLETARFLSIFQQLLDGMRAVHALGILHRDIKPANIVLEERGPVIIDFGAARDLEFQKKAGFSALVSDGFSPPEQYSRKNIQTEASDIYALAATAHFLLSGEVPPPSAARHAGEELAPAATARPDLPADVAKAIDHALALPAADRPQSIAAWLEEMPSLTAVPEPEREIVFIERGGFALDRRGVLLVGGGLLVAGVAAAVLLGRDGSISGSAQPMALRWTKSLARLSSDAFPGIAATADAVLVAAHEVGDDGNDRLLLARYSPDGKETARFVHPEPGSRAHAVLPLENGDVVVAGELPQNSLAIRLDRNLRPIWTETFEPASISTLLRRGDRIVAGLEGPESSGQAKLLYLTDDGRLDSEVVLLDRQGDSVQQIAGLQDGSIAVLGARLEERMVNGTRQATVSVWVAKIAPSGEELWRVAESGLGNAVGMGLIEAGGELIVSGKTSVEPDPAKYRAMMMRISAEGQKVWSRWDYDAQPSSGRGLAITGDSTPKLYASGSAGDPQRGWIAQIGPDGDSLWQTGTERNAAIGDAAAGLILHPAGGLFAAGMEIVSQDRVDLTLSCFG